jgi:hypothetical protein
MAVVEQRTTLKCRHMPNMTEIGSTTIIPLLIHTVKTHDHLLQHLPIFRFAEPRYLCVGTPPLGIKPLVELNYSTEKKL